MHCGQKGDLRLLSRESRSQTDVSNALGEAAHDVRPAPRLVAVAGLLAAHHSSPCPRHQLGPWLRVTPLQEALAKHTCASTQYCSSIEESFLDIRVVLWLLSHVLEVGSPENAHVFQGLI